MVGKRRTAKLMKAMCFDWSAGSAKIYHSAAVKRGHKHGRISPRGHLTPLFQTMCTCKTVEAKEP